MAVLVEIDPVSSGYNLSKINSNFQNVKTALEDAVSRSGAAPNSMSNDLDMNSNDVLNAGVGTFENLVVDGVDVHDIVGEQGPPGVPGTNGTNGTNGTDGAAATVTVGSTTTLPAGSSATATNVGTSSAAIIDFGIPKGADGLGSGDMTKASYDPANVNEQLVGRTAVQTLTNKTLTSPVINTPTGIVKGDVGLGNVDNTSDATKNSAAASLTNKKLGSLTTNGFVKTSSNDGTLSVDTNTYYQTGGALGTPSSATLTNATGLPVSGITASTSTALGVGSVELGHASDTTISRDSAGIIAVEGLPVYSNIPQNSKSAAYTTVLADAQKHILHPTADNNARTFTIDSNANVAYPIGTCITFINEINTVTISITSDTLKLAGSGSTGSRTLAANGLATAIKTASTTWWISGVGLT